MISYERYAAKKRKEPDYLCNMIKKLKHFTQVEQAESDPQLQESIRKKMLEKRIQQIKKHHKLTKVSNPEPYIKRTWVPPLEASQKQEQVLLRPWKSNTSQCVLNTSEDKQKAANVYNILNINKKMHLFGEYLYCQFDGKENTKVTKPKSSKKQMDILYSQFNKLMGGVKKGIVICNKDSVWKEKLFVNPLLQDKYYLKIIKHNDQQLNKLLVESLSSAGSFTFSSFIQFYEIFVWQQASKDTQIQFVLKLLMGIETVTSFLGLSCKIDMLCSKINLVEQKDILTGFNEVMKKLIFGARYEECSSADQFLSRDEVRQSLLSNEECISIFINVFYAE